MGPMLQLNWRKHHQWSYSHRLGVWSMVYHMSRAHMNPEFIMVNAVATRLEQVIGDICTMHKRKTTEARMSCVQLYSSLLSLIILTCIVELQLDWDCVILGAIQRPRRLFSAWEAFAMDSGSSLVSGLFSIDLHQSQRSWISGCRAPLECTMNGSGGTRSSFRTDP